MHYYKNITSTLNARYFTVALVLFLLIIFIYHTSIWFLYTSKILSPPINENVGDLGRLSYQFKSLYPRPTNTTTLEIKHVEFSNWDGEQYDVLTIGDSFSNGFAMGENPYYQDYISTNHRLRTLNYPYNFGIENPIEIILELLHNKTLDKIKPKIIIIESVERHAVERFSKPIDWNHTHSIRDTSYVIKQLNKDPSTISIINNANYKFVLYSLLYKFQSTPTALNNVYKVELNQKLFSSEDSRSLLFSALDITNLSNTTQSNIDKLNTNFNILAQILQKNNISLIFLPAVDKYNLYSPYIHNNYFKQSVFFEKLRPKDKDYYFVDTKNILQPLLPLVKDLYYPDDTHWSNIAAKSIVDQIDFDKIIQDKNKSNQL